MDDYILQMEKVGRGGVEEIKEDSYTAILTCYSFLFWVGGFSCTVQIYHLKTD